MLIRKSKVSHLLVCVGQKFFVRYPFDDVSSNVVVLKGVLVPSVNVPGHLIGEDDSSEPSFFVLLPLVVLTLDEILEIVVKSVLDVFINFL